MGTNRLHVPTYLLLALGLVVFFGDHVADARLGETRGFLRGPEGRYGEPTGETTAVLVGSQETVDVFKKDSIDVTVEYDEDGKAQRITYRKKDLSENLMTNLLQKNGGERKWSKPVRFLENKYWVSLDQEVHAVYYGNPVYKLVVMNRAAVKAERLPQSLQGRETKRIADGDGEETKPAVNSEDPLEGF